MIVRCDRRELQKLKRKMLKAYPKELLLVIWGKVIKGEYHIYLFDTIPQQNTRKSVSYEPYDYIFSQQCAELEGLEVLGTIHSHPDCVDAAPSECDYENGLKNGEYISGIALINSEKGKRRKIRVRFWGPLQQVDPLYL